MAALRLVDERGLERVTVEEIAEEAGVSPRTFFNYFATKDEALIGDQFEDPHGTRERFLAIGPDVQTADAMLAAITPSLDTVAAERKLWTLRLRVAGANPALLGTLVSRSAEQEQSTAADIAARLGLPLGHPYPELAAALLGAALRVSVMRWGRDGCERPLAEIVREAFGQVARGLTDPQKEGS